MKKSGVVLFGLLILAGGVSPGCKENEKPDKVVVAASQKARDGATEASMRSLARAEESHRAMTGKFGSLADMVESGGLSVNPSSEKTSQFSCEGVENEFSCYSTPSDYPRTGTFSYYIDQTGALHGADKGGGRASAADPVIEK
jgi:hypothetical protein